MLEPFGQIKDSQAMVSVCSAEMSAFVQGLIAHRPFLVNEVYTVQYILYTALHNRVAYSNFQ